MISATLVEPRRFDVGSQEPPSPGSGEILLRIEGCGVCGSDLGPWMGLPWLSYPLPPGKPGHEVFGTVAALGPEVSGLSVGDAVTALSYCGYSELDVARAEDVVLLPSELAGRPVLGEPLACAVNVARRSGVVEGDLVVLVGTGFLGALLVPLLRRLGPSRIVAVSRRRSGLDVAERLGADEVLTYDEDVRGRIGALTGGRMADVVIEATGRQEPLDLASDLVRVRGRLVVAGYHQDGPRMVNMQSWNWRGIDVINAHERDPQIYRSGMEEGVRLLAAGELDLEPLLTHRFPLAEVGRAFAVAESRPEGFLKALIVPDGSSRPGREVRS
jgi:NADPH:quinone reductase